MAEMTRRLKFSGRVAPHDELHQVLPEGASARVAGQLLAPTYVSVPGVGEVPQYSKTMTGPFIGYNPAQDCEGYFMSAKFQPNNNCYAYGCDIASNSFAQPGRMHGYLIPDPPTGPGVQTGAEKDGLVYSGTEAAELPGHADTSGGHFVALLISQADTDNGWPGDYHWVRCDDNQTYQSWSQKDGSDQVTNFDFDGNLISDPATANWTVNQGPVSQQNPDDLVVSYEFFAYMYVPAGQVSII